MKLTNLKTGQRAVITAYDPNLCIEQIKRIENLGIYIGAEVEVISENNISSIFVFFANDIEFALRVEDTNLIEVEVL